MKKLTLLTLITLVTLLLSACSTVPASPAAPTVTPVPEPAPGKSILYGQLIKDGKGYAGSSVRLAEVYYGEDGDAAFALNEAFSPGTISEAEGVFIFKDVAPGPYVLVVGSLNTNYQIIADENEVAIIHTLEADKSLDVGKIEVNLP